METRKKIMEFIISYIKTHGYPPSVREIGKAVNLGSTSSVQRQLKILFLRGKLESDAPEGTPRALRVPGMEYVERNEKEAAEWIPVDIRLPKTNEYILLSFDSFDIPMIGRYQKEEDGGAFYVGDEEKSCSAQYLFVNAWRPLPKPYRSESGIWKE